jgi:hypothetical protein
LLLLLRYLREEKNDIAEEVMELLLSRGADVDGLDKRQWQTPLEKVDIFSLRVCYFTVIR